MTIHIKFAGIAKELVYRRVETLFYSVARNELILWIDGEDYHYMDIEAYQAIP